jgi:polyisoprenyl-phosphate glycosyltransferase
MSGMKLSIVIPIYNDFQSVDRLCLEIHQVLSAVRVTDYEILIVDDGSAFSQNAGLLQRMKQDARLRILTLSRNFGHQNALWAGLDHASGDPVIVMDGDGEDPPSVIPQFLEKWREGYEVVYGVRLSRQVNWFMNLCYLIFYRLLARWSKTAIPLDAGEYSLISGPALEALRGFQDRTRMLRILRAWVGFRQTGIAYHRSGRISGTSKYRFLGSVSLAWDGFISGTDLPVRLAGLFAFFSFAISVLGSVRIFWVMMMSEEKVSSLLAGSTLIFFLFSLVFMCLALVARYLVAILDESRKRPPYLVRKEWPLSPQIGLSRGPEISSDERSLEITE